MNLDKKKIFYGVIVLALIYSIFTEFMHKEGVKAFQATLAEAKTISITYDAVGSKLNLTDVDFSYDGMNGTYDYKKSANPPESYLTLADQTLAALRTTWTTHKIVDLEDDAAAADVSIAVRITGMYTNIQKTRAADSYNEIKGIIERRLPKTPKRRLDDRQRAAKSLPYNEMFALTNEVLSKERRELHEYELELIIELDYYVQNQETGGMTKVGVDLQHQTVVSEKLHLKGAHLRPQPIEDLLKAHPIETLLSDVELDMEGAITKIMGYWK